MLSNKGEKGIFYAPFLCIILIFIVLIVMIRIGFLQNVYDFIKFFSRGWIVRS